MTDIELKEYNDLTPQQKEVYNMGKRHNPGWSHQQCLTYAIVCTVGTGVITDPPVGGGNGIDIKAIFKAMIEKARDYIKDEFPRIFQKVKDTFTDILGRISNALKVTWEEILRWFKYQIS